ncbi:unnamed protein product [Rotaria sp. Silwood2]|nr:unnamed protein product [Rotaria sp. Silwood2]CAF4338862.1 unnamed protein product [Rotaria sp. Silwood2]
MSQGEKRSHFVMVSSNSEDSENENQRRNRENVNVEYSGHEESNLNDTCASNILDEINGLIQEVNQPEAESSASNSATTTSNVTPTATTQKQYCPVTKNEFDEINNLNENTLQFRIRGKVIYRSPIHHFSANGRVFDCILCDRNGEVKVVVFNDEGDRIYHLMDLNQKVVVENGQIRKTDERYRTQYSIYEIRLGENSHVERYESNGFNPSFKIIKKPINDVNQLAHNVGVDVEGKIILDRGISTTRSQTTGAEIRRQSMKIEDETGGINITIWNQKIDEIPDMVMNKTIRIRKGKVNHYNDFISINVSEQAMIEIVSTMSNHKCRSIMYECTKVTPPNDIFPYDIRVVLENIVNLKKVPIMHLLVVIFAGIAHWCSRTVLNIDIDWDIPLLFYGVIIGYPGSNKSTAIGLIERATREIEEYLQIKIEDSRINGSVTIESLLHELERKRSLVQAFDEFNTFASSFGLYRADKAVYHRSVLNTLWNGPKSYFRQLVKGDIKCENPWLSIVAAAHPSAIINILKDENNQSGVDGLFARFIFSARFSPEDVHKRSKRDVDTTASEYNTQSSPCPSLSHIMYFIYLMHHDQILTLKMSPAANEILTYTHDEYNNMVIGFQGYQDILCTLFSKSRDHLYRICGLLHLFHKACSYVLKIEPLLQYLLFDDLAADSIQKMANLAKENMDEYLTISAEVALTAVELMKFYVDTKKLLYGFPLITIPPSQDITNIGPSASQQINIVEQNSQRNVSYLNSSAVDNSRRSVVSHYNGFSTLSSSSSSSMDPFDGRTTDTVIKKILLYKKQTITSSRLTQILRIPGVNVENVKKIFIFLANCQIGSHLLEKQKKHGKPRILFTKDQIPDDKESEKYQMMIDFLKEFNITPEEYNNCLEIESETSSITTDTIH